MSKLNWFAFIDLHPAAHLLVGAVSEIEPTNSLRHHLELMARVAGRLAKGPYAVSINRQNIPPEIHSAFAQENDVKRVSDAVGARRADGLRGWTSEHWFQMDFAGLKAIDEAPQNVVRAETQMHEQQMARLDRLPSMITKRSQTAADDTEKERLEPGSMPQRMPRPRRRALRRNQAALPGSQNVDLKGPKPKRGPRGAST